MGGLGTDGITIEMGAFTIRPQITPPSPGHQRHIVQANLSTTANVTVSLNEVRGGKPF